MRQVLIKRMKRAIHELHYFNLEAYDKRTTFLSDEFTFVKDEVKTVQTRKKLFIFQNKE